MVSSCPSSTSAKPAEEARAHAVFVVKGLLDDGSVAGIAYAPETFGGRRAYAVVLVLKIVEKEGAVGGIGDQGERFERRTHPC